MHGNVFEWCADWFGVYPSGGLADYQGPEKGEERVLRGGSWSFLSWGCRSAFRYRFEPGNHFGSIGCRVLLRPD
jgi:formylglycine-generating enzyme required for sulfatase activity